MRSILLRTLVASSLAAFAVPQVGHAQSSDAANLTAEEIQLLFKKQKMKTRGLVLAPASNAEEQANAPQTTVAAIEINEVNPEDQVSINISFDFDSAVLLDTEKPKLSSLCEAMKTADVDVFKIIGHTDSSGSEAYNDQLSLLRAQEVKRFIVTDCGIEANRLEAVGVGERYPFNKDNPEGDENRRVEFQVVS